jgi:trehalose synthase
VEGTPRGRLRRWRHPGSIVDGVHGLLLADPEDLTAFAETVARVVADEDLGARLGGAAIDRLREEFLGDRHLNQYVDLF